MKLTKGSIVTVDGCVVQLTSKPQKAIDGTWLVFYRAFVGDKVHSGYATQQEINEWQAKV